MMTSFLAYSAQGQGQETQKGNKTQLEGSNQFGPDFTILLQN
jgi:hypothetical protein